MIDKYFLSSFWINGYEQNCKKIIVIGWNPFIEIGRIAS